MSGPTVLTPGDVSGSTDLQTMLSSFPPVDLSTDGGLPQRLAQSLAEAIIEGRLASGTRLAENVIAERFGVSRTPVREALYALEHDGLIERPPRKQARVSGVTHAQVTDVYVCRCLIYGRSARLAAGVLDADQVADLGRVADRMTKVAADGDTKGYFQLNIAFHDALARATGNRMLLKLMSDMGSLTLRLRYMSLTIPGQLTGSAEAHKSDLVPLLSKGDGLGAEKSVHQIIARAGDAVLSHFYDDASAPVSTLVKDW